MENKRWVIFILCSLAGFALIGFGLPRLMDWIAGWFGWSPSRPIHLLAIAVFWYFWGEICLYIKKEKDID